MHMLAGVNTIQFKNGGVCVLAVPVHAPYKVLLYIMTSLYNCHHFGADSAHKRNMLRAVEEVLHRPIYTVSLQRIPTQQYASSRWNSRTGKQLNLTNLWPIMPQQTYTSQYNTRMNDMHQWKHKHRFWVRTICIKLWKNRSHNKTAYLLFSCMTDRTSQVH